MSMCVCLCPLQAGKPNVPALEVKHFQFLGWPDHGVPKFATSLISFIRRLREHHNTHSAMLVHCSAGVGRTGAFILLDSMLERMMSEKTVNVYEFLTHMREQRVHMVQTLVRRGGGEGRRGGGGGIIYCPVGCVQGSQ